MKIPQRHGSSTLPRIVQLVLHVCLRESDREFLVGDLEENWRQRTMGHSQNGGKSWTPLSCIAWLWWQVIGLMWTHARVASHGRELARVLIRQSAKPDSHIPQEPSMSLSLVEIRHAVRALANRPGLTLSLVGSLGGGIALATVMFSVLNAVLLAPLPYSDPARLVAIWESHLQGPSSRGELSPPNYLDLRERNRTLEGIAAVGDGSVNFTGIGDPERLPSQTVTWNYFGVLGVGPMLGRGFEPADEQDGGPATAVISARLWARRFNSDPSVIGRSLRLDDVPTTIVGVMRTEFVPPGAEADVWLPMRFDAAARRNRSGHFLNAFARLRPGITAETALADLDRIFIALEREVPGSERNVRATVVSLREQLSGAYRPTLVLLFGAVSFVLLMACTNAANLLLAHASVRRREMAIRVALGANQGRLRGLVMTESFLVAAAAGSLGLLVSVWGIAIVNTLLPESLELLAGPGAARALTGDAVEMTLDRRVLVFAISATVATGILFGVIPARQSTAVSAQDTLRQAHTTPGVRAGTRKLLVVTQLAIAVMLLVCAGLLLQSVLRLHAIDPGFDARNVLTLRTVLSPQRYQTPQARQRFYDAVVERVKQLPGVESAGFVTFLPLTFEGLGGSVAVESRLAPDGSRPVAARFRMVTHDYLQALRIPLRAGRTFAASDTADSTKVAVVSEAFARALWNDDFTRALGERIMMFGSPRFTPERWLTIVGIVGSVRQTRLDAAPPLEVYALQAQGSPFLFAEPRDLAVRLFESSRDPLSVAPTIRAIIRDLDPAQPVTDVQMLSDLVRHGSADRRLYLWIVGAFAVLTLALGAFGLASVMSYVIGARRHELGLRIALGALPGQVIALVARECAIVITIGLAIGLAGALLAARAMRAWLYETAPTDPLTITLVLVTVTSSCFLSCGLPLRRATRIDPAVALRAL